MLLRDIATYGLAVTVILLPVTKAVAAEDDKPGRYTMMPTDGGFIRLDTQTGTTSLCAKKADTWSCDAMPDAQQAMRDQLAKLEAENKALKEENRKIEETFGLGDPKVPGSEGAPMTPGGEPPAPKQSIPTEKDVDQMFDYLEGMVKKFKERIEKLQKEEKDKQTTPL